MAPKVSVVLPVYNQENYFSETLDSILAQTHCDFEVVIIDDGSTDKTASIIKRYASRDSRIRAFFFENAGRAAATNKAVELSSGEYCALIDADDVMMPDRLEKQLAFRLANPEVPASSSHCYYIDEKGRFKGVQSYGNLSTKEECETATRERRIVLCAITGVMIRRSDYLEVGGLDGRFWPCDDVEFVNRLLDNKKIVIILPAVLMKYRVHQSSVTAKSQWKTIEMGRYVSYCIQARREGLRELTFEQFKREIDSVSWFINIRRRAHAYSVIYQRRAGFSWYGKQYHKFVCQIAIAFLLNRKYVIGSMKKRKRLKFSAA